MQHENVLRAVANRLTVTAVDDLPRIAGLLAAQLANCSLNLQFADSKANTASVAVHKLKTRINSLLQEKSIAGRFTGAVLVKASIDNGGENVLRVTESWARGLLNCMNKPDTVEVKTLYLITLTRIFVLTQDDPALVREITTPLLPTFIKTTLNLIRPTSIRTSNGSKNVASPLLSSVLTCWIRLLPKYASVFRPFLNQLKPICVSVIADIEARAPQRDLAIRLLCWLLWSIPKTTIIQDSISMGRDLINGAHTTADKVFRAVVEEHESNDPTLGRVRGKPNFAKDPKQAESDSAGLPPWAGINEGSHRLRVILQWLVCLTSIPSAESLPLPIGAVIDLTARLMVITVPSGKPGNSSDLKYHKEASKEEKEELWVNLPEVHRACLGLLAKLCSSLGRALVPLQQTIVSQILDLFANMSWHEGIRSDIYSILGNIMMQLDIHALKSHRTAFLSILERCCVDVKTGYLRTTADSTATIAKNDNIRLGFNSTPNSNGRSDTGSLCKEPEVFEAAWALLSQALRYYPASSMSRHIRAELDRIAVLLNHEDAVLASVLNPVQSRDGKAVGASLLPFLARSTQDNMALEALLRPRMPVFSDGGPHVRKESEAQLSDDEEHEHDGLDKTDILVHLEQSVAEQQNEDTGAPEANADETYAKMIPRVEDNQGIRAQKRSIEVMETDVESIEVLSSGLVESREPKKPRSEALSEDAVRPMTQDMNADPSELDADTDIVGELNPQTVNWQAQVPASGGHLVSNNTARKHFPQDGSDSDDSEIPTIDPEFDTDEDEDIL